MANVQYTHDMGQPGFAPAPEMAQPSTNTLTHFSNIAGAVVSMALIAGVGVWGYDLIMRDVSGIPVVRAAEGEMRVKPDDPGGQLALNQGLSVNEVAADGSAAAPADRLVLAPRPTELTEEDQPEPILTAAPVEQPEPLDIQASLQPGDIDDVVKKLVEGTAIVPVVATPDATITLENAVFEGPGLRTSLRPQLRPASAPAKVIPAALPASAAPKFKDVDAASLPAGTRLVQLGAYDSEELAKKQWVKLNSRFKDYLVEKDRVIQQAQSGGRTFYRLRAMGFTDLSDARRFCSALVAEGADCIPVVTR